jgi:hypothetical protein
MSEALRAACSAIFSNVEILAPGRVRVCGAVSECDPNSLLAFLHGEVYRRFYACMRDVPAEVPAARLLDALRSANRRRAMPAESLSGVPQSYTAMGGTVPPATAWLRLYWNVGPAGAVAVFERATALLDRDGVPFRLKVMLDTTRRRRDAAVLYVPVAYWQPAARLVGGSYEDLARVGDIEPEPPLFARWLRDGVGLAEDPGGVHSFGTHRALLVALALVDVHLSGVRGEEDRWHALRLRFEADGLSLGQPHLNRPGPDPYVM